MGEGHGYGWLLLDVVAGALMIDLVPRAIARKVRLGGHIFAGIRFVMASLQGSPAPKLAGLPAGLFLFAYTFASPFLPSAWLSPASIFVLVWFESLHGRMAFEISATNSVYQTQLVNPQSPQAGSNPLGRIVGFEDVVKLSFPQSQVTATE